MVMVDWQLRQTIILESNVTNHGEEKKSIMMMTKKMNVLENIDVADSYRDHSLFLKNRSRYSSLFDLDIKNYRAWAKGLKKAGYATDPKYANKLISLIDRYELYRFDKIKRRDLLNQKVDESKKIIHNVKTGDTLFSISKKYNVPINQIIKNNNLQNNLIKVGQILIITL